VDDDASRNDQRESADSAWTGRSTAERDGRWARLARQEGGRRRPHIAHRVDEAERDGSESTG
jgi:hypothetical protein